MRLHPGCPLSARPLALLLAAVTALTPAVSRPAPDAPRPGAAAPSDVASAVRAAWLGLASSGNECPEHYDYFPDGGLAIFYCHAQSLLSLARLEALAGVSSTRAAPGGSPALAGAFRHYDPRFVQWLAKALLPARRDARFREQTQPVYDRYVAPLARQYLAVRRLMTAHRRSLEAEVRWVKDAIESEALPDRYYQARYATFGGSGFPDDPASRLDRTGWDVNVGPTAVAFWIRRELDGSAPAFAAALEELVSTYDAAWLRAGAGVVKATLAKSPFPAEPARAGKPAEALTVAAVWRDRRRLGGRVVRVTGTVIKFDANIMGMNWLHLRDGTGNPATRDHDLTVTTRATAAVGERITVEARASLERDFGAGYAYPVVLEDAAVTPAAPDAKIPAAVEPAATGAVEAAAPGSDPAGALCGEVVERLPAAPYVFVQLATERGREWAAIPARPVGVGERLCVRNPMPMDDFRSTMLKRRFERVWFGE